MGGRALWRRWLTLKVCKDLTDGNLGDHIIDHSSFLALSISEISLFFPLLTATGLVVLFSPRLLSNSEENEHNYKSIEFSTCELL